MDSPDMFSYLGLNFRSIGVQEGMEKTGKNWSTEAG
jgi:hypothetical protein